ncbi:MULTISPECIES: hypothetical protein [Burkholderia]|uniref:Uncharacterized protein n=1 Tax=Burkholderia sola TaxID=2843302 RepID=A0ABV2C947_9BURK|nr:hypothetical protein [Burkholderia sp. CpTa8-5]MBP0607667.1 hypothetical protein [Burkholderia sp. CpTa8-5]
MKFTTQSERRTPFSGLRTYYIDLIEQWPEAYKRLLHGKAFFDDVLLRGSYALPSERIGIQVDQARPGNFNARFDMCGRNPFYRISQFEVNKRGEESAQAARGIALTLAHADVALTSANEIGIPDFGTFEFTDAGLVSSCDQFPEAVGHDALHFVGCFIEQDFGVLTRRNDDLYYTYICTNYEKTPKNVDTGVDGFVGENFLEWHRRIFNAEPLHDFLSAVHRASGKNLLDMLMIDLRRRHLYTDGKSVVQRYERDFVMPLKELNGNYVGHHPQGMRRDTTTAAATVS